MSTIQPTDLFLVQRGSTAHHVAQSNLATVDDADLFVVQRGSTHHHVTGADVREWLVGPPAAGPGLWTPNDLPGLTHWWDFADAATITVDAENRILEIRSKAVGGPRLVPVFGIHQAATLVQDDFDGVTRSFARMPPGAIAPLAVSGRNATNERIRGFATYIAAGMVNLAGANNPFADGPDWAFHGTGGNRLFSSQWAFAVIRGKHWGNPFTDWTEVQKSPADPADAPGFWVVECDSAQASTTGIEGSSNNVISGDRYEFLLVNSFLSATDIAKVEGYLAHKWAMANLLPIDHPYKSAPPPAPWTPAQTDSELWLDAADTSTITLGTANRVTQWNDKSGKARNFSHTEVSRQPVLNFGEMGVVFGEAGEQWLRAHGAFSALDTDITLFVVVRSGANVNGVFDGGAGQANVIRMAVGLGGSWEIHNGPTVNSGIPGDNSVNLAMARFSYVPNRRTLETSLNGSSVDAGTRDIGAGATWANTNIGGVNEAQAPLRGAIYEMLMCRNSTLTTEITDKITGYLMHRWSLAGLLPANHPYKSAPPTL